jgi:hypothetical protein
LIVVVSGAFHCNACSYTFPAEKFPVPKIEKYVGWPKR